MINKIHALIAAGIALIAIQAMAASAYAADEFHCSVEPCRATVSTDGTGKTAHQVFIIENETTSEAVSFTCEGIRGEAQVTFKTSSELLVTGLSYVGCTVNGGPGIVFDMNGCGYRFKGSGGRTDEAEGRVDCPEGKQIEVTYNGCVLAITGGIWAKGFGYTTVGATPNREITATVNHATESASQVTFLGTRTQCLINPAQKNIITLSTANVLITGETTASVMADVWYE